MWKVLLLLACAGSAIVYCDELTPTYECGPNQVFSNCTNGGCDARNCSQAGKAVACVKLDPKNCKKGCVCAEGYLRAANGTCVLRNQCNEGCGNDPNSHPGCGVNCGRTCATYNKKDVACILVCYDNGCDCNAGYVYDPNVKKCVLPKYCTPTCGLNEVYSTCTNGGCSRRNCSQLSQPEICINRTPESCTKGCVCAEGYLRNANGTCVLESQCPKTELTPTYECGPNQVFSNCTNGGCDARNCSQAGKAVACVKLDPKNCKKGCVCAEGYLRAANGTCLLRNQCNEGCGNDPNSHPGCGVNCGRTCSTYNKKDIACILVCYDNGCDCNAGYVYDPNVKKCVLPKNCTPTCGLNEVYSTCTNGGCSRRNCSQLSQPEICINRTPESCTKGCVCAEGYLRNANGTCVLESQCPKTGCGGDPNAQAGCGYNCGRKCSDYKIKNKSLLCPRIQCTPDKCDCKEGYVYDSNLKKCVLPAQCTPTCGRNEVFSSCTNGYCGHRNCSQLGGPILCVDPPRDGCIKGCVCADGYLRTDNGTCVLEKECPTGCGGDPNAESGCGYHCGNTCFTYKVKHPICPRIACKPKGCECKTGFVFDTNINKCVVPEQCTPICGLNEQYNSCTNGGCGYQNCSQIGQPQLCIDRTAESCTKGCTCVDGYLRADNGTCIPQGQCPAAGCGGDLNAHSGCGVNCGRTCTTYNSTKPITCPAICRVGGCDCNDGYVLDDSTGKCVLPKDCSQAPPKPDDQCPGQNEFYDTCISGCSNQSCDSIGKVIHCPIQPAVCREGCRCKPGFYRNSANVCVAESECQSSSNQCTGQNEFYDTCISGCSNQSCDSIGKVIHCPIQPAVCREGCRCKPGFYRNSANVCVAESDCQSSSNQCTGQNEFYDTCISGCSNQSCESIGQTYNCPIQPAVCRTGCRCNPGFYRNASNVCVSESECPTPPCPDGEIWSRCPTVPCEGDNCPKNRNSPQTCPVGIVCDKPRCTCGPLDKRDKNGKCIKAYACPPFKCDGPNEHYDSCPAGCPAEKCSDYVNGSQCSSLRIGIVVPCRPACRCNKGYYRNSSNICIKAEKCGPVITTTRIPVSVETTTTAKPSTESNGNDGVASLKTGVTNFNGKFLYDRMKAEQGKNLITSPYSVFTPLVQLVLHATGESLKQLTSVLNVSTKDQIRVSFPALAASFEGQTSVNFSTAAKVYCDANHPLSDAFVKDSVEVVHAEAQELDFSKNTEAANTINAWVESKTNNRIQDLIQPSDLSALTRLVLVNAIYLKGDWHYAFNKNATIKDADFYLSDGSTKKTQLMFQERAFNYGEVSELDCKVLQMFYKGDNFSMVVVLPNKSDGVLTLAEKLQDQPNFDKVMGSMNSQKVKVYLPPFTITTTTDLSDILKQMGVTNIFDETNSGLSGMLKTPEDIYVSKAVQKAFIEVNEEGSEAAAANGVIVSTRAMPAPPPLVFEFRADRPFLFYITLKDTIMFCGVKSDV